MPCRTQSTRFVIFYNIFKAYYKVARKRFVDNVFMQACNHHLVTDPDTSLKFFSPFLISQLSVQQLKEIAGEDTRLKRKRKVLNKKIKNLKAGTKILI